MNLTSSTEGSHSASALRKTDQMLRSPQYSPDSISLDAISAPEDPSITLSSQTRSLTPSPSPPESTGSRSQVSLSTRLDFLSSLAASEQPVLPAESLEVLHRHLDIIQRTLISSPHEPPPPPKSDPTVAASFEANKDPELLAESHDLLSHLTSSLITLRTRREEALKVQSHLVSRLNTLTSTQHSQVSEIDSLTSQNSDLASSNEALSSTADDLRNQILELESRERLLERQNAYLNQKLSISQQASQYLHSRISEAKRASIEDEIALEAMSAAVGGLEGWLDSFVERAHTILHNSQPLLKSNGQQSPGHHGSSIPSVRGRGRFRGRYNAQSQTVGPLSPPSTPASRSGNNNSSASSASDWTSINRASTSSGAHHRVIGIESSADSTMLTATSSSSSPGQQQISEMEEGIRSWIKGFRDVEESIRTRIRTRKEEAAAVEEQKHPANSGGHSGRKIEDRENPVDDDSFDDTDDIFNDDDDDGDGDDFGDFVRAA